MHEYGGGAWWTSRAEPGVVFYVDWADQRLRRRGTDGEVVVLTPEPATPRGDRYADGDVAPDGTWLVCVREHHPSADAPATDVVNEVVRLDARAPSTPEVLVSGPDFVAAPRISHDGDHLAWVAWDHPSMPWDDTVLRVRDLTDGDEVIVAGGPGESVGEPTWHRDGTLTFLSDRTGWWNLYRWTAARGVEDLVVLDAEIGVPAWQLGGSRYAVLDDATEPPKAAHRVRPLLGGVRRPAGPRGRRHPHPARHRVHDDPLGARGRPRRGPLRRRHADHRAGRPPGHRSTAPSPPCARPATSASTRRRSPSRSR